MKYCKKVLGMGFYRGDFGQMKALRIEYLKFIWGNMRIFNSKGD